jgi:hypothetical protein
MKTVFTLTILGAMAAGSASAPASAAEPQTQGTAQAQAQGQPQTPPSNDPFYQKPKPVPVPVEKDSNKPVPVPFPPYEQRRQDYLRAREEARARNQAEPNPIGQYLVSELAVLGVYETDGGVGAFVQAVPTNTTFFVGPGTRVYNGEIVSINTGKNFDLGQVIFRQLTKYRIKKKEQDVVDTVTKSIGEAPKKP